MHNGSVGARRYMVHTDAVAGSAAARHVHTAYDILVGIYYAIMLYFDIANMWDYNELFEREWFGFSSPICITATVGVMYAGFLCVTGGAFSRSSYDLVSARMLLYHAVLTGLLSSPLIVFTTVNQDIWVLLPLSLSATAGIYMLQHESEMWIVLVL